jgi:hypothetical protein
MSGPAPAPGDVLRADPEEAAYYQAVEEYFVSRRGDPLFLSNADWLLIRKWRKAGLPLRVVLRGVRDALDGHAHSWGRGRKVGSLAYCAAEVDAARDRWQRALALGEEPGADLPGTLSSFADALESGRGLGPRAAPRAAALVQALRQRAAAAPAGGPRELEALSAFLAEGEARLVDALRLEMGPGVAPLEAEVERDLAPYAGRMPARILEQIRAESVSRRILEAHGLPRLSLFHL